MDNNDDQTWDLINSVYCIGGTFEQWEASSEEKARRALECVKDLQIGQMVLDLALESVWTAFRREIVPLFWSSVCVSPSSMMAMSDSDLLTRFHDALQLLQNSVVVLAPLIKRCESVCSECGVKYSSFSGSESLEQEMIVRLRATLHSQMPHTASTTLKSVYGVAFSVYSHLHLSHLGNNEEQEQDTSMNNEECKGCRREVQDCKCEALMSVVREINRLTWSVGVANELCGAVTACQLLHAVQKRVRAVCALPHDVHRLSELEKWVEEASIGWLSLISCEAKLPVDRSHPLHKTCYNLMIRTFIFTRINNLFSVVIDYPESRPAIEDIRTCLQLIDVHEHLVKSLRSNIQKRLLHPGVQTENILLAYVSIILALKLLEPRGVILDLVTEPVRSYLRNRKDLVRYIVTKLTDGSGLDLSEDLVGGGTEEGEMEGVTTVETGDIGMEGVTSDPPKKYEWRKWSPDTIYARPRAPGDSSLSDKKSSKELTNNELISMLVEIYGSKDMFISEYRAILADRLLSSLDCSKASVAVETMHLEHIKKRFGYNSSYISKIEVMIRDMNDSRFMNKVVEEKLEQIKDTYTGPQLGCLIVSNLFWPSFKDGQFELPEEAKEMLNRYDSVYKETQRNKVLMWKHNLGQVELELEFENRTLDLKVTPGQAAVVMMFEKTSSLTLKDVALATKTTTLTARKLLSFWVSQNVIKEVSQDTFELLENFDSDSAGEASVSQMLQLPEDDAEASAMAGSDAQRDEELSEMWLYVQGMLRNLDSASLDKIKTMLRNFYINEGGDYIFDELKKLLDEKVLQHQLLYVNGEYKLNTS